MDDYVTLSNFQLMKSFENDEKVQGEMKLVFIGKRMLITYSLTGTDPACSQGPKVAGNRDLKVRVWSHRLF